jgi:2-polyprenyl-3-methyl-5-hydroxy-6-metoxy-1,4-benzoquinol methylase
MTTIDLTANAADHAHVSVATVGAFAASLRNWPQIARADELKDLQRTWMLDAIRTACPPGSRLLEIGAGLPLVADELLRLGYHLTICDPYDGSGNGPREFESFRRSYANIDFIRANFDEAAISHEQYRGHFDAVYSISVLEHIPFAHHEGFFKGLQYCLKTGGWSIHCVDTVMKGQTCEWHQDMVARLANQHLALTQAEAGIPATFFSAMYERAADDVDTFIMGPQSYLNWIGQAPYAEHPFRRIVSTQIAVKRTR